MKKTIILIAFQVLLTQFVFGQNTVVNKDRVVRIPEDNGVITLVFQPDCPLKIENAELFIDENGTNPSIRYSIKNTSSKAIRHFSVAFNRRFIRREWIKYGTGSEDGIGDENGRGGNLLLTGETYSNWRDDEFEIVPMNEKVRNLLTSKNLGATVISKESYEPNLKIFYVGLVTKIVFEDGTTYYAKETSENILDFLNP